MTIKGKRRSCITFLLKEDRRRIDQRTCKKLALCALRDTLVLYFVFLK